jgi:hypothetical protein
VDRRRLATPVARCLSSRVSLIWALVDLLGPNKFNSFFCSGCKSHCSSPCVNNEELHNHSPVGVLFAKAKSFMLINSEC